MSYTASLIGYATATLVDPPAPTYTPTLNLSIDADPCPRVEVLFSAFKPGTVAVDVYRLAGGRTFLVRGAVKAPVAGALSRIDFEVPFGLDVQYRAEMFDSSGLSLGFTGTATVNVDVAETWVHNPLDPQGATTVAFRRSALQDIQRPFEGDIVYPQGRIVGVVVAGQRRGVQDANLDVIVDTVEQADALQAMFGGYDSSTVPVICFRIGANDRVRIPRPFFAGVLTMSEQDQNYVIGTGEKIAYSIKGSEVSPPTPALVVPLLTRADLNAAFSTRAALNAFYLTRLEANRDYARAGTA